MTLKVVFEEHNANFLAKVRRKYAEFIVLYEDGDRQKRNPCPT